MIETARGEAFRRRDHVQPNRAAEATMFQDCCFAFEQTATTVNAAKDQRTVQEVMKDHHRVAVRSAQPAGGCLTALAVQGTDD
jgi:hypothetical protein